MPLAARPCGGGAPGSAWAKATPADSRATTRIRANRVLEFMAGSARVWRSQSAGANAMPPSARVATRRRTPPTALPLYLFRLPGRRLPTHEPRFDAADCGVERQREDGEHEDAGHHRIDVERSFGLQDEIADAPRRPEVLADHGADEGEPDRGMQRTEDPARRARQVDVAQQLFARRAEHACVGEHDRAHLL